MATNRFTIDGYGQVELNNVAFRRDGRIEAQCAPDATDFADGIENGMLVAVDDQNRKIKLAVDATLPIGLVYSTEHIYDERTPGLKNFKLNATDDFLPRIGYLAVGDKFTENCLCYDTAAFANDAALVTALAAIGTTPLYGGIDATGAIAITTTAPATGPVLKVTAKTTMPNGTLGVKFQVIKA